MPEAFDDVPSLAELTDELYGRPLESFVSTRSFMVSSLKKERRGDDASAVAALRKPSRAAWALNLLVREERAQVDALLSVGDELRRAHDALSAQDLRSLTAQRHRVVRTVAARAAHIAEATGHPLSPAVSAQVTTSLDAAMADPAAGALLVAGRLVGELSYAGLGGLGVPGESSPRLRVVRGDATSTSSDEASSSKASRRRETKAAERAAEAAETELASSAARLKTAESELEAANLRVASALETLSAVQAELDSAQNAEQTSQRARDLAAKTHERAGHRAEATAAALARLRQQT